MNIRTAQRKDIPQIKELLSQVLQIHAGIGAAKKGPAAEPSVCAVRLAL